MPCVWSKPDGIVEPADTSPASTPIRPPPNFFKSVLHPRPCVGGHCSTSRTARLGTDLSPPYFPELVDSALQPSAPSSSESARTSPLVTETRMRLLSVHDTATVHDPDTLLPQLGPSDFAPSAHRPGHHPPHGPQTLHLRRRQEPADRRTGQGLTLACTASPSARPSPSSTTTCAAATCSSACASTMPPRSCPGSGRDSRSASAIQAAENATREACNRSKRCRTPTSPRSRSPPH